MITARLEYWRVFAITQGFCRLSGRVYGDRHGRFGDGEYIHTSHIVRVDLNNSLVVTRNSTYKLGVPADDAERNKLKDIS